MTKALGIAVLVAMIAVTALAGRSYRWCVPAAQVVASCCCDHAEAEPPVTSELRRSCCEDRSFGHLPASDPRAVQAPLVPPTSVISASAVAGDIPRPSAIASPEPGRHSRNSSLARAGPLKPTERCNLLQVFHC